ncbi:MAG: hypothetical protein ACOCRX_06350 [Candidatus Woesearchaeota archaeon]
MKISEGKVVGRFKILKIKKSLIPGNINIKVKDIKTGVVGIYGKKAFEKSIIRNKI